MEQRLSEQIEVSYSLQGVFKKQKADILAFKRDENLSIPDNIDYDQFSGFLMRLRLNSKK